MAQQRSQEHPHAAAVALQQRRLVVDEPWVGVPVLVGQDDPELGAVEDGRLVGRVLGVADSPAGSHEVDRTRPHEGVVAGAVAVLDLALEEPAHGLQAGVGVRGQDHPSGVAHLIGPVVVDEAPRADRGALALRERTAYSHGPRPAQRDVTRGQDLHVPSLPSPSRVRRATPGMLGVHRPVEVRVAELFDDLTLGAVQAPNRVFMAPLTRMRAEAPAHLPNDLMREYYAQRASAGLLISEGTQISPEGQGYADTPGIHSPAQVEAWRADDAEKVADL